MSNVSEEGIATVKKAACEALLEQRTQSKLKGKHISDVANRLHLAQPQRRDDVPRPPQIPESVREGNKSVAEERLAEFEREQTKYHDMAMDYAGNDARKRYGHASSTWMPLY